MSREALMKRLASADPALGVTPDPDVTERLLLSVSSDTWVRSTTGAERETDRDVSGRAPGHRSRASRLGSLAAAAAACAIAVILAIGARSGNLGSSQASAAQVLRAAAAAIQARPARSPGPGEFSFLRWIATFLEPIRANVNRPPMRSESRAPQARVTIEAWESYSPTRIGESDTHVLGVSFPTVAARQRWVALGRPDLRPAVRGLIKVEPSALVPLGNYTLTLDELRTLPDDPRTLYQRLFAHGTASQALDQVTVSLNLYPIGPTLRAAIYRALALVPDIHLGGRARTLTGQVGEVIWALTAPPPNANRDELIIDPHTGVILGNQIIITDPGSEGLPIGTIYTQSAVLQHCLLYTSDAADE